MFSFKVSDLERMKLDFLDIYDELFKINIDRIAKINKTRDIALKLCKEQQIKWISDSQKKATSKLKYEFNKI